MLYSTFYILSCNRLLGNTSYNHHVYRQRLFKMNWKRNMNIPLRFNINLFNFYFLPLSPSAGAANTVATTIANNKKIIWNFIFVRLFVYIFYIFFLFPIFFCSIKNLRKNLWKLGLGYLLVFIPIESDSV